MALARCQPRRRQAPGRECGTILRDLGHAGAALRFLREAARPRPDDVGTVLDCANLLCAAYGFDEALTLLDAALAHHPDNAALLVNRGVALHNLGRLADARASLEAAIALAPMLPQAHLNLANVLARDWRHEAALAAYARALALKPAYSAAQCGRGVSHLMLGRLDEAEAALEAAPVVEPDNATP